MGFSKQEYWTGLPFPPPDDLPNPGIKPGSPTLQADSLPSKPLWKPFKTKTENKTKAECQLENKMKKTKPTNKHGEI